MASLALVVTFASGLHAVRVDLIAGFQRGLATARSSENYRGLVLPPLITDRSGSWSIPMEPEDEMSVCDWGLVIARSSDLDARLVMIPVSLVPDRPPIQVLQQVAEQLRGILGESGCRLDLSRFRDLGDKGDIRVGGILYGQEIQGELWIRRLGQIGLLGLATAPRSSWDKQRAWLAGIHDATRYEPAVRIPLVRVGPIQAPVPAGWNGRKIPKGIEVIDLEDPNTWVRLEIVAPPQGPDATPSLADELVQRLRHDRFLEDFTITSSHPYARHSATSGTRSRSVALEGHLLREGREFRLIASLHHLTAPGCDERLLAIRMVPEESRFELGLITYLMEAQTSTILNSARTEWAAHRTHPLGSDVTLVSVIERGGLPRTETGCNASLWRDAPSGLPSTRDEQDGSGASRTLGNTLDPALRYVYPVAGSPP